MDTFWARQKADAFSEAWKHRYGRPPPTHAVILAVSVAIHETRAGDAWPGPDGILGTQDDEHNWGACTFRRLNAAEQAAVAAAGIVPTVGAGHEDRAKAAQAAILAAGLPVASGELHGIAVPHCAIHCDSAPKQGPYFVWFAGFDTDAQGAEYFIYLLCGAVGAEKSAYQVLLNPQGSPAQIAAAMYRAGYFTGFHNPDLWYLSGHPVPKGTAGAVTGAQANIDDYANSVAAIVPGFSKALSGWDAGGTEIPPAPALDLTTPLGLRRALNALGCARPLLPESNASDNRLIASLGFFQGGNLDDSGNLLDVDGDAGKLTRSALARELATIGKTAA